MDFKYSYKNFEIEILRISNNKMEVYVTCNIDGKDYSRMYTLDGGIKKVSVRGEYIFIEFDGMDTYLQLKFEYDSCLVGDFFNSSEEHIEVYACHDFNDDIK